MTTRYRLGSDEGSATLEMVIMAPVLILFLAAVILGGRVALANQTVESAAAEAARAASIARTPGVARSSARDVAQDHLNSGGVNCASTNVGVDTSEFARRPGRSAQVTAVVSCRVRLGDLGVPGVPGSRTLTASVTSVLDTYRERE